MSGKRVPHFITDFFCISYIKYVISNINVTKNIVKCPMKTQASAISILTRIQIAHFLSRSHDPPPDRHASALSACCSGTERVKDKAGLGGVYAVVSVCGTRGLLGVTGSGQAVHTVR